MNAEPDDNNRSPSRLPYRAVSQPCAIVSAMTTTANSRSETRRRGLEATTESPIRLICDATPVVLEYVQGRWIVRDEASLHAEQTMIHNLGSASRGVERARGISSALNACLIYPDEAKTLNRQLSTLDDLRPQHFGRLDDEQRIALTQACAHLHTEGAWRWLLWMLPKRLEPSLRRTPWILPGWFGWELPHQQWEFNSNFACWLDDDFWEHMAAHPDERFAQLAVATDPKADPARLAAMAFSSHIEIRDLVAVNPATPAETLDVLSADGEAPSSSQRLCLRVLQNSKTPPKLLKEIARHELQKEPCMDCEPTIRAYIQWAVLHPQAPSGLLTEAAAGPLTSAREDTVARKFVAGHSRTSQRVLHLLAEDADHEVRAEVAANPRSPGDLLAVLGQDRRREVRVAAAANPATPAEVLERLADDRVRRVRTGVAANHSTPTRVLDRLALDNDSYVVAVAVSNPHTTPDIADIEQRRLFDTGDDARAAAARWRDDTPSDLLRRLAEDPDVEMRLCAATHPNTPPDVFERLSEDGIDRSDEDLLRTMADNHSCPGSVRKRACSALGFGQERPPRRLTREADNKRAARERARRERAAAALS